MASGGFRSNAATDFLEEWKAKREKMRAKMLGDIAAATGVCTPGPAGSPGTSSAKNEPRSSAAEVNNNPERGSCVSDPVTRSSSSPALRRPEDEPTPGVRATDTASLKKVSQPVAASAPQTEPEAGCDDRARESPVPGREKRSSGPSARKGKGQIEKRKLREKRRSTGVVSIPSNESLDELDDDDGGEKERKMEEALTQVNTVQNESMTSDPSIQETPRSGSGRHKGEEDVGVNRHRQSHARHNREGGAVHTGLERRTEELEKELALERQENARLLKAHQDKDELIVKLKEEIDLLNRDLDDIEDENEQLKQENKTLLKVVGQLTR
ncbi:PRKC apoptosis WT1 regulator protein isoform X2 [Brachyhypopomus gauderio]